LTSGLDRPANCFNPRTGMTRLVTPAASQCLKHPATGKGRKAGPCAAAFRLGRGGAATTAGLAIPPGLQEAASASR